MNRAEKDRTKQIQDRCLLLLNQMLRDEDNKYCVDCDAKGPRWASWNIGIFLCIRCAGIHRNLGVHISKVKSVNLDTWTPEQVVSLQQMGNSRARAVYEANLPDSFRRPQTDSALETFIRAKYEARKYIAGEWVQPPIPKVNWDKELDEEAEKTRKKKKDKNTSSTSTVPIPVPKKMPNVVPQAIPKPSSSPKTRIAANQKPAITSASADLLGLDTPTSDEANQDDFSSFLSAPKSVQRSEEEDSFFNQPLVSEGMGSNSGSIAQAGKMTTDSILALYSKTPSYPTTNMTPMNMGFNQSVGYQQPIQHHIPIQMNGIPNQVGPPQASNPFYQMSNAQQMANDLSALKISQNNPNQNNLWQ